MIWGTALNSKHHDAHIIWEGVVKVVGANLYGVRSTLPRHVKLFYYYVGVGRRFA